MLPPAGAAGYRERCCSNRANCVSEEKPEHHVGHRAFLPLSFSPQLSHSQLAAGRARGISRIPECRPSGVIQAAILGSTVWDEPERPPR